MAKSENITQTLIKPKKTIQELLHDDEVAFENFYYMIMLVDPMKDHVKIILDDGSIRMTIRREKFLIMLEKVVPQDSQENIKIIAKFKQALASWGKYYYYDRPNNKFSEIIELSHDQKIMPQDLIKEAQKYLVNPIQSNFRAVSKQYNQQVIETFSEKPKPAGIFSKFFTTLGTRK